MAVLLGKRKRRRDLHDEVDSTSDSNDGATARALFQRAFEAKFKPLEQVEKESTPDDEDSEANFEAEVEDAWDGLSDGADVVEVVNASSFDFDTNDVARSRELKAFMSSRVPSSKENTAALPQTKHQVDDAEADNLKNDIALQRLLKESHLLDASTYSTTGSSVQGKSRLKAIDMRIQDLGGKTSSLAQKDMPLSHRRGIETKSVAREQKRRKNAAENGIILGKAKFASKYNKPREKSIGGPSIGKFKGGMLKLSGNDLRSIQGPASSSRGHKRGRGR